MARRARLSCSGLSVGKGLKKLVAKHSKVPNRQLLGQQEATEGFQVRLTFEILSILGCKPQSKTEKVWKKAKPERKICERPLLQPWGRYGF